MIRVESDIDRVKSDVGALTSDVGALKAGLHGLRQEPAIGAETMREGLRERDA